MRMCLLLLLLLPQSDKVERIGRKSSYAIVVSKRTYADWRNVVDALQKKHSATIVVYPSDVNEVRKDLADIAPRFACFVARPEETDRKFVLAVHRLTRALDDDPYGDCIWGILTGYEASDALRIAECKDPLKVRRVVAGCGVPLEIFQEGAWYSEGEKNVWWEKKKGGAPEKKSCPDDTTKLLVDEINRGCDMFSTSGHATYRDWQIGYSYKNGQFRCGKGQLFGIDTSGKRFPISSSAPKVYSALGNCLMGCIPDREAMALAWMHSAGAHQMIGYTVSTWFGYGGWGVHDYFFTGLHSYAESFFLNNQALIGQLESRFPKTARVDFEEFNIEEDEEILNKLARKHGLTDKDEVGFLWDRDTVAFYGDPAWVARVDRQGGLPFEQKLSEKDGLFTFEVTAKADGSFGRPPGALLPHAVKEIEVIEGKALVAENFVLMSVGAFKKGEVFRVRFKAKKR